MKESIFELVEDRELTLAVKNFAPAELDAELGSLAPVALHRVLSGGANRPPVLSFLAAENLMGHVDVVLKYGAKIDARDEANICALGNALVWDRREMFDHLIALGARCDLKDPDMRNLLHVAGTYGRAWAVNPLVAGGADLHERMTARGFETPLLSGCSSADFLRACVAAGADPTVKYRHGQNIMHRIVMADSAEALIVGFELGVSVDEKCTYGSTPRAEAINGNKQVTDTIRVWESAKAARDAIAEIMAPALRNAHPG